MSDTQIENITKVIGYFNPQKYRIFIEISEINLKAELAPGIYIRDLQGQLINDPIFEPYCHQKGLARATSEKPVPIVFVPRFVKSDRPTTAVSQATGFVRRADGRTIPAYAPTQAVREVPANKKPYRGMTMEAARKMGLVGRPRLVSEDYGAPETTGAPLQGGQLPPMKYAIESPPKLKTSAPLRPELTEADESLTVEERQKRQTLVTTINQAAEAAPQVETFDPRNVRPSVPPTAPAAAPAATTAPIPASAGPQSPPAASPKAPSVKKVEPVPPRPAPAPARRLVARRQVATPIQPEKVEPVQRAPEQPEPAEVQEVQSVEADSGVVRPLDEAPEAPPVLESPPADQETGKRFICAADGRPFKFRSELERYVKRNYPDMYDELMAPYPA